MAASNDWEQVELVFPSSLDYLSLVNAVAEEIAERLGVGQDARDSIGSSVIEACTNAIEHGNHGQREKLVRLSFRANPERLEIRVSDEGEGFDPSAVEDPRKPENLMRERGRGIFILRTFMDEVHFHVDPPRGTTVLMVKNLRGGARRSAI